MTKYNHAYTLGFAVGGCVHSNPTEALDKEVDKVIEALLLRVAELISNKQEYMEALEGFDTYEEN